MKYIITPCKHDLAWKIKKKYVKKYEYFAMSTYPVMGI